MGIECLSSNQQVRLAQAPTARRPSRSPRVSAQTRESQTRRLAAPDIAARKGGQPIVCLTAYTAPMAEILDEACDVLLVGDSVGMVLHGLPNTVGVTMEMMILHAQAVMRGSRKAMVVVDMPFGSYEGSPEQAYANAARMMKETGAQGVKVESGPTVPETIAFLTRRGIPVMGHIGLRPQAVLADGAFKAKGRTPEERERVIAEALQTAQAGAFSMVVEGVAESLAREVTAAAASVTRMYCKRRRWPRRRRRNWRSNSCSCAIPM